MSKPPSEWMDRYGVTERDLEVASAYVYGCANSLHDQTDELALAAVLAGERKADRQQLAAEREARQRAEATKTTLHGAVDGLSRGVDIMQAERDAANARAEQTDVELAAARAECWGKTQENSRVTAERDAANARAEAAEAACEPLRLDAIKRLADHVAVLTQERDAANARAERAEAYHREALQTLAKTDTERMHREAEAKRLREVVRWFGVWLDAACMRDTMGNPPNLSDIVGAWDEARDEKRIDAAPAETAKPR